MKVSIAFKASGFALESNIYPIFVSNLIMIKYAITILSRDESEKPAASYIRRILSPLFSINIILNTNTKT